METIKLTEIKPADYNPRKLSENSFELLRQSISELGCMKPIIVNKKNKIIIAGHQRTRAMLSLGMIEAPAFLIDCDKDDEVRFNQFHNKCEYEINEDAPKVKVTKKLAKGYNKITAKDLQIIDKGKKMSLNNQLMGMLVKYKEFACPIVGKDGDVVISSAYAYACKMLGRDCWVYNAEDIDIEKVKSFFSKTYGVFCYDMIKRNTWHQSYAQLPRLGGERCKKQNYSTLYEYHVIPYIKEHGKDIRVLDFGAGKKAYVKHLQKQGYNIIGYEPYYRKDGTAQIDIVEIKSDVLKICHEIKENGLFDVVVCDSVLNSVDSKENENNVINAVRSLCKDGGMIFMSGRVIEVEIAKCESINVKGYKPSNIKFFDNDGFTGQMRQGAWFFQKMHDKKQREEILNKISTTGEVVIHHNRTFSFQILAEKNIPINDEDALKALEAEFNLPMPNGGGIGMHNLIIEAYKNRKK